MTDRIIRIRVDARDATRGINQVESQMGRLQGTTNQLQTQLTRLAQAIAAAFSVSTIVAYADAYTNIQNRLRVVTDSTEQLTRVTAELLQVANATRAEFESTAILFSTLTRSTEELGISEERLIAITKTINQTFAVSGASAEEASNAIRQLSQGLSAGALRGEEFNSVAEQAPGILRAVAAETGKTVGELREFAATGGITAELLIQALENYGDTVELEFGQTNRTFAQSAVVARNNAVAFVGSSELIQEATKQAGETLVTLSNNLETVGEVLTFVAAIIAGRWVGSLSASAVALINKTRASLAAKTTTDALGVAITRTTVAANIGTVAMRGLTLSLAALGGPLGLILIAASAFLIFANNANTVKQETEKLISVNDLLAQSYEGLTIAQANNTRFQINQQITALKAQQEELRKTQALTKGLTQDELAAAAAFTGAAASTDELGNASAATQSKIDTLDQQIEKLKGRLGELPEVAEKAKGSIEALGSLGDSLSGLRSVSSGIDGLFGGEFNLFGGSEDTSGQDDQTAARINERIEALKLETQTISSELSLRRQIKLGVFSQEQADLAQQTANMIQSAITERELLLSEKNITDEQKLLAEEAFQAKLFEITERYRLLKVDADAQTLASQAQFAQQLFDLQSNSAITALNAVSSFAKQGSALQKGLFIVTKGIQAAQAYTSGLTAAMLARATIPFPFSEPIAKAQILNGKISAGAILATGFAGAFSGSGGGGISTGAFGGVAANQTLPTTPQAAQQVGAVEITGLDDLVDELRAQDGVVSTQFVARLLDKVQDANRLRGEG